MRKLKNQKSKNQNSVKLNISMDKDFFDLLKENARKDYMLVSTKAKQLLYRALLEKNNDDDKIVNNESIEK